MGVTSKMQHQIPNVVRRNKPAMHALKCGDLNGVISACHRDKARLDGLLEQIDKQYQAVEETRNQTSGFIDDISRDPEIFAAVCQEATRP